MSIVVESEVGLSEKPIIFTAWSISRIQAGLKTQTRRVSGVYTPGDLLWVKEVWRLMQRGHSERYGWKDIGVYVGQVPKEPEAVAALFEIGMSVQYHADPEGYPDGLWRSPLFMPRWASRLSLGVARVREQHLQEISPEDALAEGCESIADFISLWDSLNARRGYPWASNPKVRAVTFAHKSHEGFPSTTNHLLQDVRCQQ